MTTHTLFVRFFRNLHGVRVYKTFATVGIEVDTQTLDLLEAEVETGLHVVDSGVGRQVHTPHVPGLQELLLLAV